MENMADRMRAQARQRGERARREARRRKEEYLGARVSRDLRARVITRADELGIPVSILIRNVLEQAFGEGEGVPVAPRRMHRGAAAPDAFEKVLAWERVLLNRDVTCHGCGAPIARGMRAVLGVGSPGAERVILCAQCKEPA